MLLDIRGTKMPEKKNYDPASGATSMSDASKDRLRGNPNLKEMPNGKFILNTEGLTGGFSGGTMNQLMKSELSPQGLQKLLQYMTENYPRIAALAKNSSWVTDPLEEWGEAAAKKNRKGTFNYGSREAKIAINNANGLPRPDDEIAETIGHEWRHAYDSRNVSSNTPEALAKRKELIAEQEIPRRKDRPSEQRADKSGEWFVQIAKKLGLL